MRWLIGLFIPAILALLFGSIYLSLLISMVAISLFLFDFIQNSHNNIEQEPIYAWKPHHETHKVSILNKIKNIIMNFAKNINKKLKEEVQQKAEKEVQEKAEKKAQEKAQEKAEKKAEKKAQKAYTNGDSRECFNLAMMYYNGQDVKQDYVKAVKLFDKACDGGIVEAYYHLGTMYENGYGVERNVLPAFYHFTEACNGGHARGCYNLGIMIGKGQGGIRQDFVQAKKFLAKACDGGITEACEAYAILNKK